MSQRILSPLVASCAAAALLSAFAAHAAPPIQGSVLGGNDGQLQYTVKVDSKQFGTMPETRKIRSGATDAYNWKSVPPSGAVPMPDAFPNADTLPRPANRAMLRQAQVRPDAAALHQGFLKVPLSCHGVT
ncbi:DUF6013 family protein, partial [Burkholderia pseudomallei]|uniref:DUF6013 family protein n=1 Tax=Burkholderia pseudomallei TaxID=28450 RepID=UPI0021562F8C